MRTVDDNVRAAKQESTRSTIVLVSIIIGMQVLIGLVSYPFLPALVPLHWNIAGHVDSYMPKLFNLVFWPVVSLAGFFLIHALEIIGPRLDEDDQGSRRARLAVVERIRIALMLLMTMLQMITIAVALGLMVDVPFVVSLLVSLFYIFTGNYLGKLRRNYWVGIRTPWTLQNDTVWERTHRLGGWLFVVAGMIGVVASFFPAERFAGVVGVILMVVVVLTIYSYLLYRRQVKNHYSWP
ncbi:MAG: SdpI family protein [Ktedonobacteraceae bacterium]|nr:SdpI family protein [Ktedonobacteraceae bacterium]